MMSQIIIPRNFPLSLKFYILNYVCNSQSTSLLEDIKSYHNDRFEIICFYKIMFQDMNIFHSEDWINWLSNDLYSFINDYVPTMYGYTPNFYKKMLRVPIIHPKYREMFFGKKSLDDSDYTYKAYKYILNLNKLHSKQIFNIMFGILKPNERKQFITNITSNI
jgi:hypothetical protein